MCIRAVKILRKDYLQHVLVIMNANWWTSRENHPSQRAIRVENVHGRGSIATAPEIARSTRSHLLGKQDGMCHGLAHHLYHIFPPRTFQCSRTLHLETPTQQPLPAAHSYPCKAPSLRAFLRTQVGPFPCLVVTVSPCPSRSSSRALVVPLASDFGIRIIFISHAATASPTSPMQ